MNKTITLLLLFLPLFGYSQINPELEPYHAKFLSEASLRNVTLEAAPNKIDFFQTKSKTKYGAYLKDLDGVTYVFFNHALWNKMNETEKELLAFHEFAHYYLKAHHILHRTDIMNTYSTPELLAIYLTNRKQLIDKLFEKCVQL